MSSYLNTTKPAVELINLTENTIQVYDYCSGDIVSIPPEVRVIPEQPEPIDSDNPCYYVFEEAIANHLKNNGRPLDDIAIIYRKSCGRDGVIISSLVWGGNHRTAVNLCRTFNRKII